MNIKIETNRFNKNTLRVQALSATASERKSFYDCLCCQSFPVFQSGDFFSVPAKDKADLEAFASSFLTI